MRDFIDLQFDYQVFLFTKEFYFYTNSGCAIGELLLQICRKVLRSYETLKAIMIFIK